MKYVVLFVALSLTVVAAQEKVSLTTPVLQEAGVTEFRPESLYMKRAHPDAPAEIRAILREVSGTAFVPNGKSFICRYDGAEAETKIVALNKVNLSTTSLERRIMASCQTDGKLPAGTISGVPE